MLNIKPLLFWGFFSVFDFNSFFLYLFRCKNSPLWLQPTPGDHDLSKLGSTLHEYAFTQVTAVLAKK